MCRAVHAVVVAPQADQQRIRRAAGLDVQVVAMTESLTEALAFDPAPDVVIVLGEPVDAPEAAPAPAVVVVGAEPVAWADHTVADDAALNDTLPSAVTKALIARRNR